MAEKIRIEIDDATKAGVNSINQGLDNLANHGDKAATSLDHYASEQDQAAIAAEKHRHAIAKQGDELAKTSAKAKQARTFWTELWSQISIGKQVLGTITQGAHMAAGAVNSLADSGVPAFEKLQAAGAAFGEKLVSIASDSRIQGFIDGIANSIEGAAIPALEGMGKAGSSALGWLDRSLDNVELNFRRLGATIGLVSKSSVKDLELIQDMSQRSEKVVAAVRAAQEKDRQAEIAQRRALMREQFADPGIKLRADAERAARLAGLNDERQINDEIVKLKEAQAKRLKELDAKAGGAGKADPSKDREASENLEKLRQLEARRLQIIQDGNARANAKNVELFDSFIKRQIDGAAIVAKKQGEDHAKRVAMAKEFAQIEMEQNHTRANFESELAAKREQALQAQINGLKEFMNAQAGGNAGDKLRGQIDPRAVFNEARRRREEQALAEFRTKGQAEGRLDQNGQMIGDDNSPAARKRRQAQQAFQEEQARREAARGFNQDFRRGRIGQEEFEQAKSGLATSVVNKLAGDSVIKSKEIQALGQLTETANAQARQNAQYADQLTRINQTLAVLTGRGMNAQQRAQNVGQP